MEDLLIHTSKVKVDILKPNKISEYELPCICFSLNQFASFFGEYIYIFKKEVIEKNFLVKKMPSTGVSLYSTTHFRNIPKEHIFRSQNLEYEFRIYQPIDVQHYGIGIITNFNHMKGILETRMQNKIIREQVDFSR